LDETTPKSAADALADAARAALQCIAAAEVLISGTAQGFPSTLIIVPSKAPQSRFLLLRRADRTPYLQLDVSIEYAVVTLSGPSNSPRFRAEIVRYFYGVQDLAGRELFAYHWHPTGMSPVLTPHLHVSSASPIKLPARARHTDPTELLLSRLHFPTHRIDLAELARFLITEVGVGPRRPDWEQVLEER
jgi:hypothetical protein